MARWADGAIQAVNMVTSIPTLGKLALMMSLLGIGPLPAIVGLWIATLLPIIRNTYEGIRAVPGHVVDAARGMGMGPRAILTRVELPNALLNLIVNASEAMEHRGKLIITVKTEKTIERSVALKPAASPSYVRLSVADSGPGIAADVLPRIFEDFYGTSALIQKSGDRTAPPGQRANHPHIVQKTSAPSITIVPSA